MSECYQLFRQPIHHPFGAAIKFGWNSLRQRSNLRDAHLTISCLQSRVFSPQFCGTDMPNGERFRTCEVPLCKVTSSTPDQPALLMPSLRSKFSAWLMSRDC